MNKIYCLILIFLFSNCSHHNTIPEHIRLTPLLSVVESSCVTTQNKQVTLEWTPDLTRQDGTAMQTSEIGGYNVYYGIQALDNKLNVPGDVRSAVVSGLTPNTYNFGVTTLDTTSQESPLSNQLCALVVNPTPSPSPTPIVTPTPSPTPVITPTPSPTPSPTPTMPRIVPAIRINSGGNSFVDLSNLTWAQDNFFIGGSTFFNDHVISNRQSTAYAYKSERFGTSFQYKFVNLLNGTYNVLLKFAEIWWNSSGKRVFNVDINGVRVLTNFDIFVAAGGSFIAVDRVFSTNVTDGTLLINFNAVVENAKISAITITPICN